MRACGPERSCRSDDSQWGFVLPRIGNFLYMDADKLIGDLTGRVRETLNQAEDRARAIVAEAEAEAQRIRERAEAEAQERLAQVREALAGIEGSLRPANAAEVPSTPERVPESTLPAEPASEPPLPAEPEPMLAQPEIATPPSASSAPDAAKLAPVVANGERKGDEVGARIIATKMAIDGMSREQIAAHLLDHYEVSDAEGLLDFVMERASRP